MSGVFAGDTHFILNRENKKKEVGSEHLKEVGSEYLNFPVG